MSENDIMFNERYRRCAAVQLMLSTDPSYDNRTIASILKMQIRTVQRMRAQLNASDDPWRWWRGKTPPGRPGPRSSSKRSRQSLIKLPIRQIARDLGVSHSTVNAGVKEDLKCRSYRHQTSQILTEKTKNLRLNKSVRPPSSPDLKPLD